MSSNGGQEAALLKKILLNFFKGTEATYTQISSKIRILMGADVYVKYIGEFMYEADDLLIRFVVKNDKIKDLKIYF